MNKFDYTKCDKPQKKIFHGICTERCMMKNDCSDGTKCSAYTGKIKEWLTPKPSL